MAVKDIGIQKENLVMIGDDIINDIYGAQESGIKSILVKTGKYRKDLIEKSNIKPDLIINSIDEIIQLPIEK